MLQVRDPEPASTQREREKDQRERHRTALRRSYRLDVPPNAPRPSLASDPGSSMAGA